MRNRLVRGLSAAALMMSTAAAWADGGLGLGTDTFGWPRVQGRLALGTGLRGDAVRADAADVRLGSVSLMGDYYLTGPLVARERLSGGLRATSGLVMGPRYALLSNPALPPSLASPFSLSRLSGALPVSTDGSADVGTAPYLGIGYTGVANKGGLSFSADLGLAALSAGPGLRLNRSPSGQGLDDVHITPVLQLGLSYSF